MALTWVRIANLRGPKGDVGALTRGTIPANTNLNTLISLSNHSGVWGTSSANLDTYTNMPSREAGALFVIASGNGSVTQQFFPLAKNACWQRATVNTAGTSWTDWVDIVVGSAPYNRGIIPANADLNLMISAATHSGQWGTSGPNLGTYLNLPVAETGVLEVIAPGTGAVVQRFTPYAKGATYSRSVTNVTGSSWTPWVAAMDPTAATSVTTASDPGAPLESDVTRIVAKGDSLTENGGFLTRLAALMPSRTFVNHGVSGQTAGQVAARQGGAPSLIAVAGDTIPASGSVAVTARTQQFLAKTNLPARSMSGRLANVAGAMSNAAGSTAYTFTRATAGDPVNCPPNTPFIPDEGKNTRRDYQIICAGTNNPDTGIVEYVMAMARHLSPARKRFLVLAATGSSSDVKGTARHKALAAANEQLAYELGDRFLDIRRWLIDSGLSAVGVTPNQADRDAIAGDAIPPSLTTDGTHWIAATHTAIGNLIHARMVALGDAPST